MAESSRQPSPSEIARANRARRTQRLVIANLSLTAVLALVAVGIWGYRNGWFSATPKPPAETGASIARSDDSYTPPSASTPSSSVSDTSSGQVHYESKRWIFVIDTAGGSKDHMADFLRDILKSFSEKHQMDVLVLSPDGSFTSVTNGLVPITRVAGNAAANAVSVSGDFTKSSIKLAMGHAVDENATAVYLFTTADRAKELAPDPKAALAAMTQGKKLPINCLCFVRPGDSDEDLATLKAFANASGGELIKEH